MASPHESIEYDLTPLVNEKAAILKEAEAEGCVRVFGYGSLVWRPSFPFKRALHGRIGGHARRFYQASPDHRGTPSAMGRVCALVKAPGESTHGTVFEIALEEASGILDDLFFREKAGYACEWVDVTIHSDNTSERPKVLRALTFTADETGLFWAGPRSQFPPETPLSPCYSLDNSHCEVRAIAAIIASAVGPSGSNVEYLARLVKAMRDRRVVDGHLEELWEAVVEHRRAVMGVETAEVKRDGLLTVTMMLQLHAASGDTEASVASTQ